MASNDPNRAYHDHVAGLYDSMYNKAFWEFQKSLTWEMIRGHLPRDTSAPVVDLGCGTGVWGLRLAKTGFPVTCVDLSIKMLEQAARKAQEQDLENVEFIQADIVRLDGFDDGTFGFAIAEGDPLSLCSDPETAAGHFYRILRPGAILVASLDNACAGIDHYVRGGNIGDLETFVRNGITPWLAKDPKERFPTRTFTPDQARELMSRAGFEVLGLRGRTILPLRKHPELLEDRSNWKRLLKLEQRLNRIEAYIGRAPHLLVIARKPA